MSILLTGGSRGIGAAIAAALSDRTVAVHATRGDFAADLAEPGAARALWDRVVAALGPVEVLINNAGVFEANPIGDDDAAWTANWERTQRINLTAAAELCRFAIRAWQDAGTGGRIINVASRAAYRGDSPAHWHYAASKAGMVAMTKSIARGYAAEGILAFAVCPGFTMTGMAEDYLASRGGEQLLADIQLGRVAEPAEVGEMVRWLATTAPASMTGAVLDVNGASYVR